MGFREEVLYRLIRHPDQALSRVIAGEERILWTGSPQVGGGRSWFIVGVGCFGIWGIPFLLAGVGAGLESLHQRSIVGALPSGLFASIGLAFLVAPVYIREKSMATRYALTDRRLVTVTTFPTIQVTSVFPHQLKQLTVVKQGDVGSVIVGTQTYRDNYDKVDRELALGFEGVTDPEGIAARIRDAFAGEAPMTFRNGIRFADDGPPFRAAGAVGWAACLLFAALVLMSWAILLAALALRVGDR